MSTQVQYRRGTATQNNAFTGALAEITVDTTNWTLRVHDGATPGGGGNVATVAYVTAQIAALSANSITDGTSNVKVYNSGNVAVTVAGTANVAVFRSTGVNITGTLDVTGNITGGNISGAGSALTALNATNISSGTLAQARLANASLTVNGTSIALGSSATITATATNALTIGTGLGGSSYNGSTGVTITNTGVLSLANGGGITASASTGTITLGSTATSANTAGAIVARGASGEFSAGVITATATNARYADLAEMYQADNSYNPGTVVEFGGTHELTITTTESSPRVAGVVSTNPSYLMNCELNGVNAVAVALTGRVPCQVLGPVRKGDRLVSSSIPGVAHAIDESTYRPGCIIGKSLEDWAEATIASIEIAVGRV